MELVTLVQLITLMTPCLSQGFCVCVQTPWTKATWEERIYLAYIPSQSSDGGQDLNSSPAGTWRKEVIQRPWVLLTSLLMALLSLHSSRTQGHLPRVAPPTMGWAIPHPSLIKKTFASKDTWTKGYTVWLAVTLQLPRQDGRLKGWVQVRRDGRWMVWRCMMWKNKQQ